MNQAPYTMPSHAGSQQPPQAKKYDGKDGALLYDASHGGHYGMWLS